MTDPSPMTDGIPRRPTCGANTRQDTDCGRPAGWGTDHAGSGHCKLHGGSTPSGKKHAETLRQEAWSRILALTDPALSALASLIENAESESTRLAAARDILDRAGLGAKHVHEFSGPDGGPIPVEVRAAELLERVKALRPPEPKPSRKRARVTAKKATPKP